MLPKLIVFTDSSSILPGETSARVLWAIIAAVILGLYYLMKSARRKAADEYWARRRTDEERIANDPDMRKD